MNKAKRRDWDTKTSLQLIDEFRLQEVLWNPTNQYYFSKNKKHDAWCHLAKQFDTDIEEVKLKIQSIQGSYPREKAKMKKSLGTGKGNILHLHNIEDLVHTCYKSHN